jgi:ketosteroid isomerase-like protein
MDVLRPPARRHRADSGPTCGEGLLTRFTEDWSEISIVADRIIEAGDNVVAEVRFVAQGRDGIEVSMQFVHVWTAREGQVVRFRGYPTLDQALEAVSV